MPEERALPNDDQSLFLAIAEQTTDCFIAVDCSFRVLAMNKAAETSLGIAADHAHGRPISELLPEDHAPKLLHDLQRVLESGVPQEFEEVLQVDGVTHIFATSTFPIHDADGRVTALGCIARDASARLREEESQRTQRELSRSVVDGSPVAMLMTDKDGKILFANPASASLSGYEIDELVGSSIELLVPSGIRSQHVAIRSAFMKSPSSRQAGNGMALHCQHKDGHRIPVEIGLNSLRFDDGSFRVIATVIDISGRKKLERAESINRVLDRLVRERTDALLAANRALDYMARHDSLTGLHNRRALIDRLREEFLRMGRTGERYALAFVDIDHFKAINDTFGHQTGDAALRHVAAMIQDVSRNTDFAARIGGEEFVVLLPNTAEDGMVFGEKLRGVVANRTVAPFGRITVSIGVAVASPGDPSEDTALNAADRAMYRAKAEGRNRIVLDDRETE